MGNKGQNFAGWLKKPFNLTAVLFSAFAFFLLPILNSDMLRWFDEMSLFESDRFFWKEVVYYPAGLLKYVGAFLMQFFYYPWLGSAILVALWLCIAYVSRKAFAVTDTGRSLLLFIVPLCLLCSVSAMDEGWLTMSTQGYFYSQTIGTLSAILLFMAYRNLSKSWARILLAAVIALTYLPLGYYALLTLAMCTVYDITKAETRHRPSLLVAPIVGIAIIATVPWLCYSHIPGISVDNDSLYLKGLPEFSYDKFDRWLIFVFIVIALTLMAFSSLSAIGSRLRRVKMPLSYVTLIMGAICTIVATLDVSPQVKCAIKMLHYADYGQWEDVMKTIDNSDIEPDFSMMVLNNLARKRLGMPLVYGIQRPNYEVDNADGNANVYSDDKSATIRREGITINVFLNVPVNYHLGKANNSYRWAMEHTVKFGRRVFFLKYMVRAALLNGDFELAQKYNDILLGTMFHRKWAKHFQMFIDNPQLMSKSPEFAGIPDYVPPAIFL